MYGNCVPSCRSCYNAVDPLCAFSYEAFIPLRSLVDNSGMSEAGWNFLQHEKNTSLHGYEAWLLNRVLNNDQLRKVFFYTYKASAWRRAEVQRYLDDARVFLEKLLLLIHITGGQPARRTELMTLQCRNPLDGEGRRNIYLENGLVTFVTFHWLHQDYPSLPPITS